MCGPRTARGIVKGDGQVGLCRVRQALFDGLPRRQAVAQADDGKIVRQRRAQKRRGAARRRQAGDDLDLRLFALAAQLVHERRHAVNAAVARADHGRGLARARKFERKRAALCLLRHGRFIKRLVRIALLHKVNINSVADDGVARLQRAVGADRHILIAAGADAHHDHFTQRKPPNAPPPRRRSRRPPQSFSPIISPRRASLRARRRCRRPSSPARRGNP